MSTLISPEPRPPSTLKFHLGALDAGEWFEVTYMANVLHYRAGATYTQQPPSELTCTPDAAHWVCFWQELDRIGVWSWKRDYTDPGVLDGSGWRLEIQHAGRNLKTGGDNGYPGADGPEYSPDTAFGQFLAALEQLTGFPGML